MLDSPMVDLVIGLVVIFYALAVLCSGVVELVANLMKKRAKYLIRGIRDLLEEVKPGAPRWWKVDWKDEAREERRAYRALLDAGPPTSGPTLNVTAVMAHGLVAPYKQATPTGQATRNPSYLPASVFSRVVVDLLTQGEAPDAITMRDLRAYVKKMDAKPQVKQAMHGLIKVAGSDVDTFLTSLEQWFDAQMDRVSGSYKRWAKRWVVAVAAVVVLAGGVDSIAIARTLYADDAVRATVTQAAGAQLCPAGTEPATCAKQARDFFEKTGLPLGWSAPNPQDGKWGWPLKVLGLLASIGAASLGAPFWYKILDRVGTLKNAGNRPASRTRAG